MAGQARMQAPALRSYRGAITRPDRWSTWKPREGDIHTRHYLETACSGRVPGLRLFHYANMVRPPCRGGTRAVSRNPR